MLGIHGGNDIVAVVPGEGHKGICGEDSLLQQHFAAGGVAMDDVGQGDQITKLVAAGPVRLHHGDVHAALLQNPGQVHRDAAAAHDHYPAHRLFVLAGGDKELPQLLVRAGDAQQVAGLQGEIAVGDDGLSAPLHNAHQYLSVKTLGQVFELDAVQLAPLPDPVLDHLGASLGESVHPDGAGETQDTADLLGAFIFRVHDHRKAQGLPEEIRLAQIGGVPDAGNDVLGAQLPGRNAADHVGLVAAGGSHQQVGLGSSRLQQRLGIGGAALHADHVQIVGKIVYPGAVIINHGNVMAFRCQNVRYRVADLPGAGNDYLHANLHSSRQRRRRANILAPI